MTANNPGFSVPFGRIKDAKGNMIPLYVGTEWQIFLQGLFDQTLGTDTGRIDSIEVILGLHAALINDSQGRADEVSGAVRQVRANHDTRIRELEFLGAIS